MSAILQSPVFASGGQALSHICNTGQLQTGTVPSGNDSTTFQGHLENTEYQVWMDINFNKKNILVPNQEIFGEVPGYFGAKRDTRKWIISDVTISENSATLTIINDYGSEDLTARLTYAPDGSYILEQLSGSTIRIVVNKKWVKIPKKLILVKQQKK